MATPPGPPVPPSPDLPPPGAPPPFGGSPAAIPPTALLPPRRTPVYIGIAVAVVIVVVVLVLALLGVLPFFKSAEPGGPSFGDARAPAQSTANGHPGGPWALIAGGGIALHADTDISKLNRTLGALPSNCTISQGSANPPTTLKGVGNVSQGFASAWAFLFRNSSGGVLAVSDFAGSYQVQGTASGAGCTAALGSLSAIPDGVVDSTTAAKAADDAGGYAFLRAHPTANGTIGIIGAGLNIFGLVLGSEWAVSYSACPFINTAQLSEPIFSALVNATTGTVVQALSSTMACPVSATSGKTPIGSALAMGTPAEATTGGHYWYNFTVQTASGGLTWGNTAFQVQTPTGSIVTMPVSATLAILSLTGTTVASYSFATGIWQSGSTLAVTNQQELSISTPSTLSGDTLHIIGTGSFTGTVVVTIP